MAEHQHVSGAGGESCETFLARAGRDGLLDAAALQWVMGYLTGRIVARSKPRRAFEGPEGIARRLVI